jgi:hypothetical protein
MLPLNAKTLAPLKSHKMVGIRETNRTNIALGRASPPLCCSCPLPGFGRLSSMIAIAVLPLPASPIPLYLLRCIPRLCCIALPLDLRPAGGDDICHRGQPRSGW